MIGYATQGYAGAGQWGGGYGSGFAPAGGYGAQQGGAGYPPQGSGYLAPGSGYPTAGCGGYGRGPGSSPGYSAPLTQAVGYSLGQGYDRREAGRPGYEHQPGVGYSRGGCSGYAAGGGYVGGAGGYPLNGCYAANVGNGYCPSSASGVGYAAGGAYGCNYGSTAVALNGGMACQVPQQSYPSTRDSRGATPRPPENLVVSGCQHGTVGGIVRGKFALHAENHGRPIYKKETQANGLDVMLYFWDDRDGPNFGGWWFGPKVGGDQVWAYNADKASQAPPMASWQVPWDGPVDQTLRLQMAGPPQAAAGGSSRQVAAQAPQTRGPPPEQQRQREEEDRRRREAERQRAMVEQQRREEERRRREADQKRRQKEEEEAARARREAEAREAKRRREEEEIRRKEQQAALAVRKVIQRVRVATPENYDNLRAELEEAQATHLESLGSQREKVSQEAEQTLQQAQRRIDEINEKRAEDERRRAEDERRAKEEAEKVERLMEEVTGDVKAAEAKVTEAQEAAKKIPDGQEGTPEAMVEAASATEKVIEECRSAIEASIKSLDEKWREMGVGSAARRVEREMDEYRSKLSSGKRLLEKLGNAVASSREKAARKAAALKKDQERREFFKKYDVDKDDKLSREEIAAFAKAEFDGFEVPPETFDKIMRLLEPVTYEKFHAMHLKVAIARSEVRARAQRAEEQERKRRLEEQRLAIQKVVDEAGELLYGAEEVVDETEVKARPLTKETDMAAEEIEACATETEEVTKRAEGELAVVLDKLKKVEEDCEACPELQGYEKRDVPRLRQRHERAKARVDKVVATVKKGRERAVRKAYAEMDQKRMDAVASIRSLMSAEGKNVDQLLAGLGGGSAVSCEKFTEFLQGLKDLELADGQASKLCEHIAGEASEISKERFLELIKLYYKCVKGTVLSEDISIKSKTVRRLEVGEVLEALEGPAKEENAGVQRVRCMAVQDDATGWVTIAGNQGTSFLEPGGNFYSVVKETLLTDGLSVQDSKTVRRLAKGEVIEVLEFQKKDASVDVKRIRGKAKLDGASGWITVASNQGTIFLEPC